MTSSTSTGRCPSFISPPSRTNGSRADPGSACGAELDPEPFEGLGQLLRVVERPAVDVPPVGCPDLGVIARPDDHGLAAEADRLRAGRPAAGPGPVCRSRPRSRREKTNRWKRRDFGSVIGRAATFADRSSQPAFGWIARQSSSQRETIAPGSSCARNFDGTAIRPLSSTVCRYSPVNTCRAYPCVVWAGVIGVWIPHFSPLRATSLHSSEQTGHVKADFVLGTVGAASGDRPRGLPGRRRDPEGATDLQPVGRPRIQARTVASGTPK